MEQNGLAAMLATKRSIGVVPEVDLRKCVTHMAPPSANKAGHSGFETQRRHYQKPKTRVSVALQKRIIVRVAALLLCCCSTGNSSLGDGSSLRLITTQMLYVFVIAVS